MSIFQSVPMRRLTERTVRSGFVMAWRLATSPTNTSPVFEKATTAGVVRAPSALGMPAASPASRTDTTELVVPRSIPTALLILWDLQGEVESFAINLGYRTTRQACQFLLFPNFWRD